MKMINMKREYLILPTDLVWQYIGPSHEVYSANGTRDYEYYYRWRIKCANRLSLIREITLCKDDDILCYIMHVCQREFVLWRHI